MQGVREIANLVFWVDNSKQILMADAILNRRALPKDKQIILQQIINDFSELDQNEWIIKNGNGNDDHQINQV